MDAFPHDRGLAVGGDYDPFRYSLERHSPACSDALNLSGIVFTQGGLHHVLEIRQPRKEIHLEPVSSDGVSS
jgi:hypothetical protein